MGAYLFIRPEAQAELGWMTCFAVAPFLVAAVASLRDDEVEHAMIAGAALSMLALAGLVGTTGGLGSPAMLLFITVPALFATDRKVAAALVPIALLSVIGLAVADAMTLLPAFPFAAHRQHLTSLFVVYGMVSVGLAVMDALPEELPETETRGESLATLAKSLEIPPPVAIDASATRERYDSYPPLSA